MNELSTSTHQEWCQWHKDRDAACGRFRIAEEAFQAELTEIGKEIVGEDADPQTIRSAFLRGACNCGRCRVYSRCTFASPQHVGDVMHNLYATGSKAAAYVAMAARKAEYWPEFAGVLALGCGAGGCLTGLDLAERLPSRRFGVEIEPHALRVLPHVVQGVHVADDIQKISLPEGPLLVVASLVWNLRVPSRLWAEQIATGREEFFVLSVTRPRDFVNREPSEKWKELGFKARWPFNYEVIKNNPLWDHRADSYGLQLDHWTRS